MRLNPCKGPFIPKKSERESEKYERTSKKDQRKNFKHQIKFSLSRSLSLGVNSLIYIATVQFWQN